MSWEVNPAGTAAQLERLLSEPLARQVARMQCALTMNIDTIREISEAHHAKMTSGKALLRAERTLCEFFGLSAEEARLYAKAAIEAALLIDGDDQ